MDHRAFIMERGGRRVVQELTSLTFVTWGRERDATSTAGVKISATRDDAQADFLADLARTAGRYELKLWRGDEAVWEGPLTLPTFTRAGIEINARDISLYMARTIAYAAYDNSFSGGVDKTTYAVQRALNIMAAELVRKEYLGYNLLTHVVGHQTSTDARTSRNTKPAQMTVLEHIDSMARSGGIDYTVLGRAMHVWDTSKPAMGYAPRATENDFRGEMHLASYVMDLATKAVVTDGQGNFGEAGGVDNFYGEWEVLATAYDEDQTQAPTVAELHSQAQRNVAGRNPTPMQLRVPDNSSVNMDGVLEMKHLVPGVYIPLETTMNLVDFKQMQKLKSMKCSEDKDGETVQVTMYPATKADPEPEP